MQHPIENKNPHSYPRQVCLKNLVLLNGGCLPNRFLLPLSAILQEQETRRRFANPSRKSGKDEACNMTIMSQTPCGITVRFFNVVDYGWRCGLNCPNKRVKNPSYEKWHIELSIALETCIQVIRNLDDLVFEITNHLPVLVLLLQQIFSDVERG